MNILFKFFITVYFILSLLYSVSAPPFSYEVEQIDGSQLSVQMFGHEYYSWIETSDGYVVDWVDDGELLGWYYCELNNEGKFSPTNILVTNPSPSNLYIPKKSYL